MPQVTVFNVLESRPDMRIYVAHRDTREEAEELAQELARQRGRPGVNYVVEEGSNFIREAE